MSRRTKEKRDSRLSKSEMEYSMYLFEYRKYLKEMKDTEIIKVLTNLVFNYGSNIFVQDLRYMDFIDAEIRKLIEPIINELIKSHSIYVDIDHIVDNEILRIIYNKIKRNR